METLYSIAPLLSNKIMRLALDYSLKNVNPLAVDDEAFTPPDFLRRFEYTLYQGRLLDMIPIVNGISWQIFSPRIIKIIRTFCREDEVELLPLPVEENGPSRCLNGYSVLGVKRRVKCLDLDASEYRRNPEYISALYKCVIKESAVPADLNCFMIKEYPAFQVFRATLANSIMALRPTGFSFERIETS
jgi:hypothetical protein